MRIDKIIFATGNKGKLREVKEIFRDSGIEITAPFELGRDIEVEETEDSFEGNAFLKADTIFKEFNLPVVADDSGLEVEQLDGVPGVYSARYAGEDCTFDDNNNKLIKELSGFPTPHKARFVSCAVFFNGKHRLVATGHLNGVIIDEKRGSNGFGYDPIFIPDGFDQTISEMTFEEKNSISHRRKSFERLKDMLRSI